MKTRPSCLRCGKADRVVPIAYGLPAPEAEEAAQRGEAVNRTLKQFSLVPVLVSFMTALSSPSSGGNSPGIGRRKE